MSIAGEDTPNDVTSLDPSLETDHAPSLETDQAQVLGLAGRGADQDDQGVAEVKLLVPGPSAEADLDSLVLLAQALVLPTEL